MKPEKGFEARNGWNVTVVSPLRHPSNRPRGPEGYAQ
jgi:hypothetical protein